MREHESTTGDAFVQIAEESPEALRLLGNVMAENARQAEWLNARLYENEVRRHEQTKAELRAAREHLALVQRRIEWLFGGSDPDEVWP